MPTKPLRKNFSQGELVEIKKIKMENYDMFEAVENRAHITVFHARNIHTGDAVLVKKHVLSVCPKANKSTSVVAEISAMSALRHPNIVRLLEVIFRKQRTHHVEVYVFLEYTCNHTTIWRRHNLLATTTIGHGAARRLLFKLLKGLAHCHSRGYIHRNINPKNLLINASRDMLKIAHFESSTTTIGGVERTKYEVIDLELPYRAPELVLLSRTYTSAIDIWSAGCVFAEMLIGKAIFSACNEIELLFRIMSIFGVPEVSELVDCEISLAPVSCIHFEATNDLESLFPELKVIGEHGLSLLKRLLERNPRKRITAASALESPYFRGL